MNNLLEYLKVEFTNAPLWQKVFLLSLLAIMVFYFTLFPLFHFSWRHTRSLEIQRSDISSQLRSAKILMQDEKVIIKKLKRFII